MQTRVPFACAVLLCLWAAAGRAGEKAVRLVPLPQAVQAKYGDNANSVPALGRLLRSSKTSRQEQESALDALTYFGSPGAEQIAMFAMHTRMPPEWQATLVEKMGLVADEIFIGLLNHLARFGATPEIRVSAFAGLVVQVEGAPRDVAGKPSSAVRSLGEPSRPDDCEITRKVAERLRDQESTPPEVRASIDKVLAAIQEREERDRQERLTPPPAGATQPAAP